MPHLAPRSSKSSANCLHCATLATCFLGTLTRAHLEALQPLVRKTAIRQGSVLAQEGEVSTAIKIIKLGTVFGYRRGREGVIRPIGIAGRGAVFGIFGYYGHPNLVSAIASTSGYICEISVIDLKRQTPGNPLLGEHLFRAKLQSVARIASWSEAMRLRGVVNQLAYTLLLLGEAQTSAVVELPTHTLLSQLLGATRETIVRALTTLEKEGVIRRLERRKCHLFEHLLLKRLTGCPPQEPV
jgi:CRP-like cAMP-binding protein